MKNITLSADERLIADARAYANAHNTTLNQLIRDYLERIARPMSREEAAHRFVRLARSGGGRSEDQFSFDREEIHRRGTL